MPEIQAFRGLRYDLGHVGSLSDVVAPPYDVIGPQLQDQLYKHHPANVIRLILNRDEPGDDATQQPLRTGRQVPQELAQRRGAVHRSAIRRCTSITRCSTTPVRPYTRRGFMARCRLSAIRRREHLSARRDDVGPEAGPFAADARPARRT